MSLKKIVKNKILKNVLHPMRFLNKYNILIVDSESMAIVSSCFRMTEILQEGITLIEDLAKHREPMPTLNAVYLISPTSESIKRLIFDFEPKNRGKKHTSSNYKSAHVFFIDSCSDQIFKELSKSCASKHIKTLKEINISFVAQEDHVFLIPPFEKTEQTLENQHDFRNKGATNFQQVYVNHITNGIANLCSNLGVYPILRYHSDYAQSAEICYRVEQKLDELMKFDKSLGIETDAELIILDRTFDLISPLIRELTLQAMCADVLSNFSITSGIFAVPNKKPTIFDETDPFWLECRHEHIADVLEKVVVLTKSATAASKHFVPTSLASTRNVSLREIGETVKRLPAHQKKVDRLEDYVFLAEQCMLTFNKTINEICLLEQDLAAGQTPEGVPVREVTVMSRMQSIFDDPTVSSESRLRLVLIYILAMNDKKDDFYEKLIEYAKLNETDEKAVWRMIRTIRKHANQRTNHRCYAKTSSKFNTSRWMPKLGNEVIEAAIDGMLDESRFLYIGRPPRKENKHFEFKAKSARFGSKMIFSPTKKEKKKLIIFIAGGITPSEMRIAYEINKRKINEVEVVVGSDFIITPRCLLEQLRKNN